MKKITLSQSQARDIAYCIFPDIAAYIAEHRAEYEAWLRNGGV